MRVRTFSVAGLGALALVLSSMVSGSATAASPDAALTAAGQAGVTAPSGDRFMGTDAKGKCGSKFGPSMPTPDGLIAWNDGGAFDTAGAADVKCAGKAKKRTIKSVSAYGYFGAATETFNVTFYGNSTAGGTDEPDDSKVICDYQGLTGSAGGQYPTHALTTLQLDSKCKLPKGTSWVTIQNANASGPWYWEMQEAAVGVRGDWVDRGDAFGSGCTTLDNDRYLVDCLGYPYGDYMLQLK